MLSFHEIYHPLTSRPYLSDYRYIEYQACEALRPYIACYWVTGEPKITRLRESSEVLVVPDTCMDIIIRINHTRQTITSVLCGIQDAPFVSVQNEGEDIVSCFAIRFHFWAAHLFLNLNFKDTSNQSIELGAINREWDMLFEPFLYLTDQKERIEHVETFLLKKIYHSKVNENLFNSIEKMLATPGGTTVKDVCAHSCVGQRQMERLFLQYVGLPLKRIVSLVRYQNVWHDLAMSGILDIQDAVYRYGYTDQAHLLKEFKRFHGVTLTEARTIAEMNR